MLQLGGVLHDTEFSFQFPSFLHRPGARPSIHLNRDATMANNRDGGPVLLFPGSIHLNSHNGHNSHNGPHLLSNPLSSALPPPLLTPSLLHPLQPSLHHSFDNSTLSWPSPSWIQDICNILSQRPKDTRRYSEKAGPFLNRPLSAGSSTSKSRQTNRLSPSFQRNKPVDFLPSSIRVRYVNIDYLVFCSTLLVIFHFHTHPTHSSGFCQNPKNIRPISCLTSIHHKTKTFLT